MRTSNLTYRIWTLFPALALTCLSSTNSSAQQDRIEGSIDAGRMVALQGSVHPLAKPQNDQGPAEPALFLPHISFRLKSSSSQQASLAELLADIQNPQSPNYRHWLTPEQYADRFGISQRDLAKITDWLVSAGFKMEYTARGRDWVAFSGTAAQVQAALHTTVHRYQVHGEPHFAASENPSVPAALAPLIGAVAGLHDFHPRSAHRQKTTFTDGDGNSLAPADLATIYDLNALYRQGLDGTGQKIVIVGQAKPGSTDLQNFRTTFGLANQNLQLVPYSAGSTTDPNALIEANLDLEWAGAIAPGAQIVYVYSTDAGNAATYAIDQNLAPIISESFGACQLEFSASELNADETQAQKANALGITWIAASGDSGAAACDYESTTAILGASVLFPAAFAEVTGVGGTEFSENTGLYWGASNSPSGDSATSYIPEVAWNDTAFGKGLAASGGGYGLYQAPSWQTGPGIPKPTANNQGSRLVPDVSMAASNEHDPYRVLTSGQWQLFGGTSAATPVFAAIVAILNQYLATNNTSGKPATGVGNINPVLYSLAQTNKTIFHDIVSGNNIVPCDVTGLACTTGQIGFKTTAGYDMVTGLGSVDAYNLVTNWSGPPTGAIQAASLSPSSVIAGSAAFSLTVAGTGFTEDATVNWNGTPIPTTFVRSTQLKGAVDASLVSSPGGATVTVSSGGAALYFTIRPAAAPSANIIDSIVTAQPPPATGCVAPPSISSFPTGFNNVYLYLVADVAASDTLTSDWLSPDGTVSTGASWPRQTGRFCYSSPALPIAALAEPQFGAWQARVYDNGKQVLSIPFNVSASSVGIPFVDSVKNTASYASGVVSPGEIVALFGSGLGPAQLVSLTLDDKGFVTTELGGTTVMFDGVAAPLVYTSANQVAAIVPYEVSGTTTQVTVSYNGQTSAAVPLTVAASVPGLFTYNASGFGQVAALNQDSSINSIANPAPPNSVIVLFATGEGQTSPQGVDGELAGATLPKPLQPVTVNIGGKAASVAYAGAAPGEVAGVLQVNATIPDGVFGSAVPVQIQVGSIPSPSGTTIAVASATGEPVFTVTSSEMATGVSYNQDGSVACTAPSAQSSYATTATAAWAYFTYSNAQTGDVLAFDWVHPSGAVDSAKSSITVASGGSGCVAGNLAIQGSAAASEPGYWQVRLSRNGSPQVTIPFSIQGPAAGFKVTAQTVTAALIANAGGAPQYCSTPVTKNTFQGTDLAAWVWFTYSGAQNGDVFTYQWIHPSGTVDPNQPTQLIQAAGSGCTAWSFPIAGTSAATSEAGVWHVSVLRNGTQLFTLPVTITAVFAVTNKMSTGTVDLGTCATPIPQNIFHFPTYYSTATAWVWFSYVGGKVGDTLLFDWVNTLYSPSGVQLQQTLTQKITAAGTGCAATGIELDSFLSYEEMGGWQVTVYRNSTLLFVIDLSVQF